MEAEFTGVFYSVGEYGVKGGYGVKLGTLGHRVQARERCHISQEKTKENVSRR